MNPPAGKAPHAGRTLRRLFLTLFLRGRSSRGMRRETTPKTVGAKLAMALFFYGLFGGLMAASFIGKPVFMLSLYIHSMTLVFLGMFIAASAGEVLFNKEEGDILMHRPVTPRALLWAKIGVLVQVSLWLAGAFNVGSFFVGAAKADPWWLYPLTHAVSTACEALFCAGAIVMIYQLCLRWFGRERLEGLMTTAQVIVAIGAVMMGQVAPQLIARSGLNVESVDGWWLNLLPPAWFAGLDDALAGTGRPSSWVLAGIGLVATATVLGLAFGKLARDYEMGLQALNETPAAPPGSGGRRRWVSALVHAPPLRWWLRDSVARASFLLTTAYLLRDRDVKLRIYPGIAPMLVMPFIFLLQEAQRHSAHHGDASSFDGFGVAFAASYLGVVPMLALSLIRYSQQWQASDLFRVAPMPGPSPLCNGARRAILCFLTLPLLMVFGVLVLLLGRGSEHLPLLIPGILVLPIYALIPCIGGHAVPLSLPTEEAKSAGRGLTMMVVMLFAAVLAGVSTFAWASGWFKWFLGFEVVVVAALYAVLRTWTTGARWDSIE